MRKQWLKASWLTCALVPLGCTSVGKPAQPPPTCPVLSPAPAALMQPSETERKVSAELLQRPEPVTPK